MLIGEYRHTLDDKNRMSLPAKFRKEFGSKVILTNGLDKCLFVFSIKEWEIFSETISKLSFTESDKRKFTRFMLGGAVEADIDSNGRILIPDFLKSFANLESKVVVTGVYHRAEIWNESLWVEYKDSVKNDIDVLSEKLGESGVFV